MKQMFCAFLLIAVFAGCGGGGDSAAPDALHANSIKLGIAKYQPMSVPRSPVPTSSASPGTFPYRADIGGATQFVAVGENYIYWASGDAIGAVTYTGAVQEGQHSPDGDTINGMIEGTNGAMYYAETGPNLSELLPTAGESQGTFTQWNDFLVTTGDTNAVISDPNGVLWFTEISNASVIRMTTWGSLLTRTALTASGAPRHLTVGSDNDSVWVTENAANKIAKLALTGALVAEYSLPANCGSGPNDIAVGSDGNVYFTESTTGQGYLGQVTPSGAITCYENPQSGSTTGIVEGPDGNIWVAEHDAGYLVKFNVTTHTFGTPIAVPTGKPQVLVLGADQEIWLATYPGGYVLSFQPN